MTTNQVTCYLSVSGHNWRQEHYETASRDASKRARQLRKLGYHVSVSSLGNQVTNVGRVKMSMVSVYTADTGLDIVDVPKPDREIRI